MTETTALRIVITLGGGAVGARVSHLSGGSPDDVLGSGLYTALIALVFAWALGPVRHR